MNSTAMEMPHPVTTRNNGNSGKRSAASCGRFLLLEYFATTYYGPFLRENPVKVKKYYFVQYTLLGNSQPSP